MENSYFEDLIMSLLDSTRSGYGFVNDFMRNLLSLPYSITRVNHVVQLWDCITSEGERKQLTYYSSSKLNMAGVNRRLLMKGKSPVTSKSDLMGMIDSSFVWRNNFVAIPINVRESFQSTLKLEGVVLLLSNSEEQIGFDANQLSILYSVMNIKKPVVDESECVKDSMSEYRISSSEFFSISDKWNHTLRALKRLSIDEDNGVGCGIGYASFWKINKKERIKDSAIFKQMECAFGEIELPHESNKVVGPSSQHYLRACINKLSETIGDGVAWPISVYHVPQVKDSFMDGTFFTQFACEESQLTILIIPIEIDSPLRSVDICCLYVKDIVFTPLISMSFVKRLQSEITADLTFVNDELQSRMSMSLMMSLSIETNYVSLYSHISKLVSDFNSVNETLIYTLDSSNNLLLTSKEDINAPATFVNKSFKIGSHFCYLPEPYSSDDSFKRFLYSLRIIDEEAEFTQIVTYQPKETKNSIVRNGLAMAIHDPEYKKVSGILLLINKVHPTDSFQVKVYDNITVDNVIIVFLCSVILYQFDRWNKADSQKNYLLKKLRHEIPHCTKGIDEKMRFIKDRIVDKGVVDTDLNQSFLSIALNNNRINTLASFFAAVDYKDSRFAENLKKIDLLKELESNLPLFKEDASSKGVDVIIEKDTELKSLVLLVSDFFPMAVVNIVNNAIRYCSQGTVIVIKITNSQLVISDIGIPILAHEQELIFDDGYRGSNAKERDAQGIGYGLHISRRVLRAHNSDITVASTHIADENIVLEKIIYDYICSLNQKEKYNYIHSDTDPSEETVLNELLFRISSRQVVEPYSKFYNNRHSMIKTWLERDMILGGPSFILMDELWFQDTIALVSFTIQLSNVAKYEENYIN